MNTLADILPRFLELLEKLEHTDACVTDIQNAILDSGVVINSDTPLSVFSGRIRAIADNRNPLIIEQLSIVSEAQIIMMEPVLYDEQDFLIRDSAEASLVLID